MSVPSFFNAFLRCYNGDPMLNFDNLDRLNTVIEGTNAKSIFLVSMVSGKESYGDRVTNPLNNPPNIDSLANEIEEKYYGAIIGRLEEKQKLQEEYLRQQQVLSQQSFLEGGN